MQKMKGFRKSYGFLPYGKVKPVQGHIRAGALPGNILTTDEVKDRGKNHCGAVCMANLFLLLENRKETLSPGEWFDRVHEIVGNGPVIRLRSMGNRLLKRAGRRERLHRIRGRDQWNDALSRRRPVVLLLGRHPLDYHWVLVVGRGETAMGPGYEILTGWDKTPKWMVPEQGILPLAAYAVY